MVVVFMVNGIINQFITGGAPPCMVYDTYSKKSNVRNLLVMAGNTSYQYKSKTIYGMFLIL